MTPSFKNRNQLGQKSLLCIIPMVVAVLIASLSVLKWPLAHMQPDSNSNTSRTELTISGRVTDNDTSCYHDGICKVKVNEYWVITDLGGDPSPEIVDERGPRGNIINANGTMIGNVPNNAIGKYVDVFAKVIGSKMLSLYGKKDYYIKFTD